MGASREVRVALFIDSRAGSRGLFTLGVALIIGMVLCGAQKARAFESAPPLLRPAAIVVNVQRGIGDTRFMAPLEQLLKARLQPAVSVNLADVDLSPLAGQRPVNGELLLRHLAMVMGPQARHGDIQVFVIKEGIRLAPARFNFAVSGGDASSPLRIIVVSLAELQEFRLWERQRDNSPAMTAERVAKMIIKNSAKVAGYSGSVRCIFGFPTSLNELDALPLGYCEPDLTRLVAAGIARPAR